MKRGMLFLSLGLSLSLLGSAQAIRPGQSRISPLGGAERSEAQLATSRIGIAREGPKQGLPRYERLLASGEEVPRGVPSAPPRAWSYRLDVDPVSGARTHSFIVPATAGAGASGAKPTLNVRIRTDGLCEIFINWGAVLGSELAITWNFDSQSPVTTRWLQATDSQSAFFFGDTDAFIRSLLDGRQFVARVSPSTASPITARFPVDGFRVFSAEHPEVLPLVLEQ